MQVLTTIKAMQSRSREWRGQGETVALVPTMGYLHEGHLELIRLARNQAGKVVVSIFVNPSQFAPGEDYEDYPRDFSRDQELCRKEGVDLIFNPAVEEMYEADFSTWVVEEKLSANLCGKSRPGHFRGVTTIVCKLFNATLPDVAVFGQKDAQQALIIERMVRDLNFPVEIVLAPIVRDEDGLAVSSRNVYLSAEQRRRALSLSRGLQKAVTAFTTGERRAAELIKIVRDELESADAAVDYVELVDRSTLQPVTVVEQASLLAVAAFFGGTRLIDNCFLEP
ncbi:MAG: pantoate--beta-alanine ligase [Verrucomicrobiota bacterium]